MRAAKLQDEQEELRTRQTQALKKMIAKGKGKGTSRVKGKSKQDLKKMPFFLRCKKHKTFHKYGEAIKVIPGPLKHMMQIYCELHGMKQHHKFLSSKVTWAKSLQRFDVAIVGRHVLYSSNFMRKVRTT